MLAVDGKGPKPLYRQIYDAYRMAIVEGSLRPGQRIPSTRVLAAELGVSRFPVLSAYDQLLAEGYFESRVGAGTVVSSSLPDLFTSMRTCECCTTAGSAFRAPPRTATGRTPLFAPPPSRNVPVAAGSGFWSIHGGTGGI
jgi:DNA-binding transcriptional regulator YhcF (GntR family)